MSLRPLSIALVDDSIQLRKFLRNFLPGHGFTIASETTNGQELLSQLDRSTTVPDLCLLDINMPVMDGYETSRQLKNRYPSIKILAYSFYDDKKRREKIIECGAHAFICKDASSDELLDALTMLVSDVQISYGRVMPIMDLPAMAV